MACCLGLCPEPVRVAGVTTTEARAQEFRESLRPFGLDEFMISNEPARTHTLDNGRVLAEFRTMPLVVWYPQKLNEMSAAGLDIVVYKKKSNKHPPVLMYYVRYVVEIEGGNYGHK